MLNRHNGHQDQGFSYKMDNNFVVYCTQGFDVNADIDIEMLCTINQEVVIHKESLAVVTPYLLLNVTERND